MGKDKTIWDHIVDQTAHALIGLAASAPAILTAWLADFGWFENGIVGFALGSLAELIREIIQQKNNNTPDFWKLDTLIDIAFGGVGGLIGGVLSGVFL